jgi:acyl-CoA reductase-like NAD-dependent aldehyde dehydrogenase
MPPVGGIELADSGLLGASSFVDGGPSHGGSRGSVVVLNPANDGVVRRVAAISSVDIARCIDGAERAFHGWSGTPPRERARLLQAWNGLIEKHAGDLATIMTLESGKPILESRRELLYAGSMIEWAAGEAVRGHGSCAVDLGNGMTGVSMREPVGVALLITPWSALSQHAFP